MSGDLSRGSGANEGFQNELVNSALCFNTVIVKGYNHVPMSSCDERQMPPDTFCLNTYASIIAYLVGGVTLDRTVFNKESICFHSSLVAEHPYNNKVKRWRY